MSNVIRVIQRELSEEQAITLYGILESLRLMGTDEAKDMAGDLMHAFPWLDEMGDIRDD